MLDIKKLLISMPELTSVSGFESERIEDFKELIGSYFDEIVQTASDSLICYKYSAPKTERQAPTLLIDTHFDEIGMMVSEVKDDGKISFKALGGLDLRSLCGSDAAVYGTEEIRGIIVPIDSGIGGDGVGANASGKLTEVNNLAIYTGLSSEQIRKKVKTGDSAAFISPAIELLGGRIAGKAFDNRASIASVIYMMELLGGDTYGWNIAWLLSSGEETNMRGAATGAFTVKPDAAIVIDVGFAKGPQTKESETIVFGGGPSISMSAVTDRRLSKAVIAAAEKNDVKIQVIVEAVGTGTNANIIPFQNGGIPCAVISIPLANMHTPNEIIDCEDIVLTSKALAAFIKDGGKV